MVHDTKKKVKSKLQSQLQSHASSASKIQLYPINKENGIYDPLGLHRNPFTNEPYKNIYYDSDKKTYADYAKSWSSKIVYQNKDKIINTINNNQIILLTAGTGVGKTILVPRLALQVFDYKEKVICTIPKQLPTFSTAEYIAKCMDVGLGEEVGYYFHGTNQTNKNGKESTLIFTTPGSLISRMTGNDPLLSDYKCIIVDEAHERSVQTDQLLLLLKDVCKIRKDLKVIIMSATIDLNRFRNYYPSAQFRFGEVDAGSEVSFRINEAWLDKMPADWKQTATDITLSILKKTAIGDIIIFVKSGGDANQLCILIDKAITDLRNKIIQENKKIVKVSHHSTIRTASRTASHKNNNSKYKDKIIPPEYLINPLCIKLDSASPKEDQLIAKDENKYKTLRDSKGYPYSRKIVITTNVAESSITVEGAVFVIDSGYEYTEAYEPNSRVRALLESTIAQSAVIQRTGRVGRTRIGYCFHLYSQKEFNTFAKYPIPSIEKSDITNDILDLMRLPKASNVKNLRSLLDEFISPPHEKFILNSLRTLQAIGAITTINPEGTITPMGYILTKFRVINATHARAIIASYFYGCPRSVCDIIALITIAKGKMNNLFLDYYADKKKSADWNKKELQRYTQVMKAFSHPLGDHMTLLKAYKIFLKIAEKALTLTPTPTPTPTVNLQDDAEILELDSIEPQTQVPLSVKKWGKDNFVKANRFADVRRVSRQLYDTLMKAVRPIDYKHYAKQDIKQNAKQDIKHFINVDAVFNEIAPELPVIASKHSKDTANIMNKYYANTKTPHAYVPAYVPAHTPLVQHTLKGQKLQNMQHMQKQTKTNKQKGGFLKIIDKHEAIEKLEPDVKRFETEEDNIMMALAIGNYVNFAIKGNGKGNQGDIYTSCFAQTKKFAKINKDSFLNSYPKVLMYDEMFMMSLDAKILKLNIVSKIPDNVFNRIKELYGNQIKYCI